MESHGSHEWQTKQQYIGMKFGILDNKFDMYKSEFFFDIKYTQIVENTETRWVNANLCTRQGGNISYSGVENFVCEMAAILFKWMRSFTMSLYCWSNAAELLLLGQKLRVPLSLPRSFFWLISVRYYLKLLGPIISKICQTCHDWRYECTGGKWGLGQGKLH